MECRALERSNKLTRNGTEESLPFKLLVAFIRELVGYSSSDAIILAMWAAAKRVGVSREVANKVLVPILSHREQNNPWPEGFMA